MPAGPLIAAIGSGVAAAAPVVTAGLGVYNAVKGINDSRDSASAAQNQATAAANSGQQSQDAQLQAYFNSDPAFQAEYNRNRQATGDTRSPTQWLSGFLAENPSEVPKFQQFSASSGIIPGSAMGPGGTVDVGILQQQAQGVANQNAAASAALERQYNPGAAELREQSLLAVIDQLKQQAQQPVGTLPQVGQAPISAQNQALLDRLAAEAGAPIQTGYDSPLTRAAVQRAQEDLALGGILPQDVAQLVARRAFARAGTVGNLGLGRDISARDLGLTSLDLRNQRLAAALQAGGAEAGLEQTNAAMRTNAELARRQGLLSAQQATAQNQAQQQDEYFKRLGLQSSNYFNQNQLLQSIQSGEFARALAAAQLGQNIAQPASGLSPGSVADVAIGNVNLANNAQQQANAAAAQAAANRTQFGSQLIGSAISPAIDAIKNIFQPKPATISPDYTSYMAWGRS